MSDTNMKLVIGGLTVAGALSGLYYLYKAFQGEDTDKNLDEIDENTQVQKLDIKNSANKPLNLTSKTSEILEDKNPAVKEDKKQDYALLNINIFSEVFRRAINFTFEQLMFNFEIIRDEFNDKGQYIGQLGYLTNINVEEYKNEILIKIANDNYNIVNSVVVPEHYNKSLHYYLSSKK